MPDVIRRRDGKLTRIKERLHKAKYVVKLNDNLHDMYYDEDGTLKSTEFINSQRLGKRDEGRHYPPTSSTIRTSRE